MAMVGNGWQRVISGIVAGLMVGCCPLPGAIAQVIPDASLGAEQSTVALPGIINGGATRGGNLFHSFSSFNVPNGGSIYFANPAGIERIFSRVTGSTRSEILGTLGVLGNADLFLLNPNGILFGPNARLDVRGSFVASTHQGLIFDNGFTYTTTNPQAPPLLTINLPIGLQSGNSGKITHTGSLTAGQDLTLSATELEIQGSLQAGRNLTLHAQSQIQIRDTEHQPFVALAGDRLLVQGDRGVDIFALHHRDSGFLAGGDLVLRSAVPIIGDAHYWSGGAFRVEQLDGKQGDLVSIRDPIIRANGNVSLAGYQGASLHILAGGSVTIPGNVIVGLPDTTGAAITETIPLSDGSSLQIDGSRSPTLDIRAGIDWQPPPGNLTRGNLVLQPNFSPAPTSAAITVGGVIGVFDVLQGNGGQIVLTNQYQPNPNLAGDISVQQIAASDNNQGGAIVIDSRNAIRLNRAVETSAFVRGNGGNMTFLAQGDIQTSNQPVISAGWVAGDITLKSGGTVLIPGGLIGTENQRAVPGNGSASRGTIRITAKALVMQNRGRILNFATGSADGGAVTVVADSVSTAGFRSPTLAGGFLSRVLPGATGNGGDITITTRTFTARDGAGVASITNGAGRGGNIAIAATDAITLVGNGFSPGFNGLTAITSQLLSPNPTQGGRITLSTPLLTLQHAAQIGTIADSSRSGSRGGDVVIQSHTVRLDGITTVIASEISQDSRQAENLANGGNLSLSAENLSITNGARFSTNVNSGAQGNGGDITIQVGDAMVLDAGTIPERFTVTGITSRVAAADRNGSGDPATGRGGNLSLTARSLTVLNGARVDTSTLGAGFGGAITMTGESILLDGVDQNGSPSGLFTTAFPSAQSNGGNITLRANGLSIRRGAQLNTETQGRGNAGDMLLTIADQVSLQGENSGLFANTANRSSGKGGTIRLKADRMEMGDRARISANSQGTGEGGEIQIQTDSLRLSNRASISVDTASNIGGNIQIDVQDILLLRQNSSISTNAGTGRSAAAIGKGGDIAIHAQFIVAVPFENSDITANAFLGSGGNISIQTQGIFGIAFRPALTPFSDITASSEFGLAGTVAITTLGIDPVQATVNLPTTFSQPPLAQGCRVSSRTGSFKHVGQGGVAANPADPIVADALWQDVEPLEKRENRETRSESREIKPQTQSKLPNLNSPIVEAQGWIVSPDGRITLIAGHSQAAGAIAHPAVDCSSSPVPTP
jgi:filamentous hemagglutinin family protein